MRTIAVIPAFHEETRIAGVLSTVQAHVDEIIVVDDGSKDQTAQQAKNAGAITLRHAINRGQGAALKTGTFAALMRGADVIVHFDADGQHDPQTIQLALDEITYGTEIVLGSRFLGVDSVGMSQKKKVILWLAGQFNRFILGIHPRITDPQNGFRVLTRKAAQSLDFQQDRFAHCSELLRLITRSNLTWKEIPTKVIYTDDTVAKGVKVKDGFQIIWQLFLGYFH